MRENANIFIQSAHNPQAVSAIAQAEHRKAKLRCAVYLSQKSGCPGTDVGPHAHT